jgi:hypothetical protein
MKIRKGFVSNSSSSSFLLAFSKEIHSFEDVKEMLFGNGSVTYNSKTGRGKFFGTSDMIAGFIYGQISKGNNYYNTDSPTELLRLFTYEMHDNQNKESYCRKYTPRDECLQECPLYNSCSNRSGIKFEEATIKRFDEDLKEITNSLRKLEDFRKKTPECHYYLIECECQSSLGAFLTEKHKKVFKNVEHICMGQT